eukprot:CAMPEP_0201520792 /NCGR_PEP_ID=MMETSP0161_2-20130828/12577_1 /ASSEMBLY_ACC=CAM_ASM_000251 /TAXON_ID=180227 /ORGANISM="Neoparamoeba aestuarina, Strain SoJaBio B1-5/56/2" /LENGTH=374 /DNA_ID=CAMNT_0047919277 /DNA_START=60 /DNA_END=1184 /DNA_ORIENTATION=+
MTGAAQPCLKEFVHRGFTFKNRLGLSPLTRGRADYPSANPNDLHVDYYTQRASGGFILTEATGISRRQLGWFKAPGIYNEEHVEHWKKVTESVHKANGLIFCQMWAMGRAGHSDVMGDTPLAPSPIALKGEVTAAHHEKKPYETPIEMTQEDINNTVNDFRNAARNAIAAGFDGVQIHSANGYLVDTFLQSCSNKREDKYGGSLENRLRFLKEILEAVTSEVGPERTWIRFSPNGAFQEMGSEDNLETFDAAIQLAASYKIGVIEVMDGVTFGFHEKTERYTLERARKNAQKGNPDAENPTAIMGNVGHTAESANKEIGDGHADLISIGRPYISNPDLPDRIREGIELAPVADYADWWTKEGAEGYTTFPKATA